jgi:lipopolysaccharide assembly outer membrane protein LptD (OstA)
LQQRQKDNPDIQAEIGSFDAVLPDTQGRPWVAVSGVASAKLLTDPSGNRNATSTIKGTNALIYQNGLPAFTLVAPLIIADQKSSRVTASGGVNAASAGGVGTAVRKLSSDTMIWDMRRSTLVGKGNIRLYDSTGFDIPAASFKADGTLARIDIYTDEKPVSGWWK